MNSRAVRRLILAFAAGAVLTPAMPPTAAVLAANPDGRIAYVGYVPIPGEDDGYYEAIYTANPDGSYPHVVPNTGTPDEWPSEPQWSPDGSMLAFVTEKSDSPGAINVISIDGSGRTMLAEGSSPAWTPDGEWISYRANDPDNDATYKVPVGGGDAEFVIDGAGVRWSPDGTRIAFYRYWPAYVPDVFVRDLATGDELNLTDTPETYEFVHDWSPDSQSLVIDSVLDWPDDGKTLVMQADGSGAEEILAEGWEPAWSPSGAKMIFDYGSDEGEFLRVIQSDGTFVADIDLNGQQPDWGTALLVADTTAPSTSAFTMTPRVGQLLSGSAIPMTLSWSGRDDTGGSGIARYELARSVNGGSWATVSTSLTSKSTVVTVASSGTVRFRIRAVDRAGNAGVWTYTSTVSPRLTQQTSSAVKYGSTWSSGSSSSYSGGSVRYTKTAGRTASYTFTGRSIALVTSRSTTRGKVKVYVNGSYQATVDTYRSATQYRSVVWQKTWSTSGARTIKLVVSGTSGRPRVDLDAFVVIK